MKLILTELRPFELIHFEYFSILHNTGLIAFIVFVLDILCLSERSSMVCAPGCLWNVVQKVRKGYSLSCDRRCMWASSVYDGHNCPV